MTKDGTTSTKRWRGLRADEPNMQNLKPLMTAEQRDMVATIREAWAEYYGIPRGSFLGQVLTEAASEVQENREPPVLNEEKP